MATFETVLSSILDLDEKEILSSTSGDWEMLDPEFNEPMFGSLFAHRTDDGFEDCVLGVDFDDSYVMCIVVAKPKFRWHGHHLRVTKGKELHRIPVLTPPTKAQLEQIVSAVEDGVQQTRKKWTLCEHCGESRPAAYIEEPGVCMGCAHEVLGIVY